MERRPTICPPDEAKQITMLYGMAEHYHKLCMCYKWKHKKYCKLDGRLFKLSGLVVAVGVVVGAATVNVIVLASVSAVGMLMATLAKAGKYEKKAEACDNAYKAYKKLLTRIKKAINNGGNDMEEYKDILSIACHDDDMVAENCPTVNGEGKRYDKEFANIDIRDTIPRFVMFDPGRCTPDH